MIIMNYECDDAVLEEEKSIALELSEYRNKEVEQKATSWERAGRPAPL